LQTYNAIVKYTLEAEEKTSIQYFKKKDFLHERVDRSLISNIKTSCKQYKQVLEKYLMFL